MNKYLLWRCKHCNEILGIIRDNHGVKSKKVQIFRQPIKDAELDKYDFESIKPAVILDFGVVVCGKCGASRIWNLSDMVLDDLIKGRRRV